MKIWVTIFSGLLLAAPATNGAQRLVANEALGIRVAPNFRVTQFADETLAYDIYAMTFDAQGRVVVTGPGYIRRLESTNGNQTASQAVLFAATKTGGMGMCFEGHDLLFFGDGTRSVFHDANGDGVADGPPEPIAQFGNGEHGAHAIRKGPDGFYYLIGGNDSGFNASHANNPASPIREPEAGCLLRFAPDLKSSEIIAQGLRNPYDFDFNWMGDAFTYDSDVERDFFLPWYTPTRIYHIGYGQHHGWRLTGWTRSWNRPDYYADTIDILSRIGRGSPTGVTSYRHEQFPERYRNGLFACDWVFGKVYFVPLQPAGGSYTGNPEIFLEPIGTHGFAPTDCAVAPDGSLFISIGGRKTRGSIYRVEYVGPAVRKPVSPATPVLAVLRADQPLDAWSRAQWVPQATKVGKQGFLDAAQNNAFAVEERVRAIEILTELFGGVPYQNAKNILGALPPVSLRARLAWSLGRAPCDKFAEILFSLASDSEPAVRRCALEAIASRLTQLDVNAVTGVVARHVADAEKRARLAAVRLAAVLPEKNWQSLWPVGPASSPQARLSLALASILRSPRLAPNEEAANVALSILEGPASPDLQLQAVRLIILALGDYNLTNPSVELYTAYEVPVPLGNYPALVARIQRDVRPLFPAQNEAVNLETSRLLAMVEDGDIELLRRMLNVFTAQSSPVDDFHYLIVLARLRASRDPNLFLSTFRTGFTPAKIVANAVLDLDRKLANQQERDKQNWSVRLGEAAGQLLQRDPLLLDELISHPNFAVPGHVTLALSLGQGNRERAAAIFLSALQRNPRFTGPGRLIQLLSTLPPGQVKGLFRAQWANPALRDDLIIQLAVAPEEMDREKFLTGLKSLQTQTVQTSLNALFELPRDPSPANLAALLEALQKLFSDSRQTRLRERMAALFSKQAAQKFSTRETGVDPVTLRNNYGPLFNWFAQKYPAIARKVNMATADDPGQWNLRLGRIDWRRGDATRGFAVFNQRGCQSCHAVANALGPDLLGVADRFSQNDLFAAIVFPNKDVAPQFRTTLFQMKDGQSYTGIVAFESADGVILQTGANTTVRLSAAETVSRQPSDVSLMPGGLLAGATDLDLADLYSYLRVIERR